MNRNLEYQVTPGELRIDFDMPSAARYECELRPDNQASGDGVVLALNAEACLAFARLFAQLAEYSGHVHLGYDEGEPQGPGIRIVVHSSGRIAVSGE